MSHEALLSALFSVFSSFMGSFAGGGSTTLLLSFLLLTSSLPFLTLLALSKVAAFGMVLVSGNIHRQKKITQAQMLVWATVSSSLGIALGTYLAEYVLDDFILKKIVAFTLVLLALYEIFRKTGGGMVLRDRPFTIKEYFTSSIFFFFFNIINAITGGMGLVFVAFYVAYLKTSYIQAAAYSITAGIFVLGAQALYLVYRTQPSFWWILAVVLGSMIGAYGGTHLQYAKGNLWVKRGATMMMVVLAALSFS